MCMCVRCIICVYTLSLDRQLKQLHTRDDMDRDNYEKAVSIVQEFFCRLFTEYSSFYESLPPSVKRGKNEMTFLSQCIIDPANTSEATMSSFMEFLVSISQELNMKEDDPRKWTTEYDSISNYLLRVMMGRLVQNVSVNDLYGSIDTCLMVIGSRQGINLLSKLMSDIHVPLSQKCMVFRCITGMTFTNLSLFLHIVMLIWHIYGTQ